MDTCRITRSLYTPEACPAGRHPPPTAASATHPILPSPTPLSEIEAPGYSPPSMPLYIPTTQVKFRCISIMIRCMLLWWFYAFDEMLH
jgi:hypothetical protein